MGRKKRKAFTVLQVNKISEKTRFYVQGVTDYGEVMTWERCAFVDVSPETYGKPRTSHKTG